jgi:hypothetical protein
MKAAATAWGTVLVASLFAYAQEPAERPPVRVTIRDEKPTHVEFGLGLDSVQYAQLNGQGSMAYSLGVDNNRLKLETMWTWVQVDEQLTYPGGSGKMLSQNQPLEKKGADRPRVGHRSVWEHTGVFITQEIEVVPTRAKAGASRRIDAVVVRYTIENKDKKPRTIGIRPHLNDLLYNNNRGLVFAAANQSDKMLDGVELKGDKMPDVLQIVEPVKGDVKNATPTVVGHITCNLGGGYEKVSRICLSRGGTVPGDRFDAPVMPSGGHAGVAIYFDPKVIKAGGVRKVAYAFGVGVVPHLDGEGPFAVRLSGSFEPGKLFSIAAQVQDPAQGQTLTLELPQGMQLVEGKDRQPVPAQDESGNCMVLWKARVVELGEHPVRVHSSTGLTQTKIVTIARP